MSTRYNYLTVNRTLETDDYLVSANEAFFAIMQGDGRFCVYRGSGPGDNHGLIWNTNSQTPGFAVVQRDGNFCIYQGSHAKQGSLVWHTGKVSDEDHHGAHIAVLQDDGNFCVYQGVEPNNHGTLVWNTGTIDPVEVLKASKVKYDLDNILVEDPEIESVDQYEYTNGGDVAQTNTYEKTVEYSFTKGWSETRSWKVKASTSITTGIPVFVGGKVTVEAEGGEAYTNSTTSTKKEAVRLSAPITVPANSTRLLTVTLEKLYVLVPYSIDGVAVLRSGTEIPIQARGNYKLPKSYKTHIHISNPADPHAAPVPLAASVTSVPA